MSFQQTTSQQQQQFGTTTDTKQHTETQQTGYVATHAQMGTVCSPSQPITQHGQEYQPSYTDTTMAAASTLQSTPQQPVTGVQQGATREQSSYQQQQQGGTFEEQGDRLLQHEKLTGSGYQQTDLQGGGFTSGMPQYQQQLGASSPQQHTATAFGGTSNTVQRTPTEQTQVQPLGFTDTSGFGGMDSTKTTDFQQQQQQVTPQQQTFGDAPTTGFGATRDTAATGFAGGVTALGTTTKKTAQQEQFGGTGDTAHIEAGETGTHEATGTRHSDSQPLKEVHPQQQQLDEVKGLSGFGAATTTTATKQSPMPTPTHEDRGAPAPNTKAADQAAVAAIVPQPGHRAVDIHDEPKVIQKFLKKEEKIETKEVKDRDHVEHKAEKKLEKILEKEEKHREKLEKKDEKSDTHVTPLPAAGVQDVTASKDKPSTFTHETTKTPTLQQTPQATTKGITTTTTTGTQPTQFEKAAGGITGLSGIAAMKDATHIQDESAGQQRQQQQFGGQQTTFGEGEQQTQFQKATGGITTVSGISAIRDSTHIQPGEQEQGQPQFDTQQQTTPQNLTAGEQMQRDQQKIHNAQPAPNEPATQLQQASQKSLQHETTLPREGITPAKEATLTQDQPVSFTPGFSSAGGMGGAIGQRPLQHELTAGIEGGERQQPTQHGPQSAFNDQKVEGFEAAPEHLPVEHTAGIAWFADTTKSAAELSKEAPVIHSPSSIPVDAANPVLRNAPALPPATEAKQPTMTQRDLDKVSTTSTAGGDSGKFVASNFTDPTPQTQQQQAQRG